MFWPTWAQACATCAVGDPTLVVMGVEQPYQHRTRFSFAHSYHIDASGQPGVDRLSVREQRFELSAAYAPASRWMISLRAPMVYKSVQTVSLARDRDLGLGDIDLRVRYVLFRDTSFAAKWLLSAVAGIEMPSARLRKDASQAPLPLAYQFGSGSWDPIVGATLSYFADPFSVYSSSIFLIPTQGWRDSRVGWAGQHTAILQWQPLSAVGVQVGVHMRHDMKSREYGERDDNSGGLIGFVTLGLVAKVSEHVLIQTSVAVPVIKRQNGFRDEGFSTNFGVSYDL